MFSYGCWIALKVQQVERKSLEFEMIYLHIWIVVHTHAKCILLYHYTQFVAGTIN